MLISEFFVRKLSLALIVIIAIFPLLYGFIKEKDRSDVTLFKFVYAFFAILWLFLPVLADLYISFPPPVWIIKESNGTYVKESYFLIGKKKYTFSNGTTDEFTHKGFHIIVNDTGRDFAAGTIIYTDRYFDSLERISREVPPFNIIPADSSINRDQLFRSPRMSVSHSGSSETIDAVLTYSRIKEEVKTRYSEFLEKWGGKCTAAELKKFNKKYNEFMNKKFNAGILKENKFIIKYFGYGEETPPKFIDARYRGSMVIDYWIREIDPAACPRKVNR